MIIAMYNIDYQKGDDMIHCNCWLGMILKLCPNSNIIHVYVQYITHTSFVLFRQVSVGLTMAGPSERSLLFTSQLGKYSLLSVYIQTYIL